VCTSILVSFIAWDYKFVCGHGNPLPIQTQANARPILFAWVFLSAILVGDAESFNISIFLAAIGIHIWKPIYSPEVDWSADSSHFHKRWRTQESLAFSGFIILLVGVLIEKLKSGLNVKVGLQTVVDLAILGIGIAGAVSAFDKNSKDDYAKKLNNYTIAYAIAIPLLNFVGGLLGLDAIALITTFFAFMVLDTYDEGSRTTATAYYRGGLQLCQSATLLSIFVKVFPVAKIQEGELTKIIDNKANRVAAFFFLAWATVGAIYVPNHYSKYFLIAIITFGALTQQCKNFGRTTFFIVTWLGVVGTFPLGAQGWATFPATGSFNYVQLIIFLASVSYVKLFAQDFEQTGAPAFGETSENVKAAASTEPTA